MYMWISIKISLKFVPKGPVNNIPALLQKMPRHRPGDKPVSEAIMVRLLTHICVTRPESNWRIYTSLDFNKLTDLSHLLDFAVQVCNMILNCPSIFFHISLLYTLEYSEKILVQKDHMYMDIFHKQFLHDVVRNTCCASLHCQSYFISIRRILSFASFSLQTSDDWAGYRAVPFHSSGCWLVHVQEIKELRNSLSQSP